MTSHIYLFFLSTPGEKRKKSPQCSLYDATVRKKAQNLPTTQMTCESITVKRTLIRLGERDFFS